MAKIIRNRTIRPSTRLEKSKSYKVDTKNVDSGDKLVVNINHESKSFFKSYTFNGKDLKNRNSISFRVNDNGTHIDISWSDTTPKQNLNPVSKKSNITSASDESTEKKQEIKNKDQIDGLNPITDKNSQVLILGSMPGVESLKQQAYYSHPRNLFWKLIEEITGEEIPSDYNQKKTLLLENKIAVWDMCKSCIREGSLDNDMSAETPNDLNTFVEEHPNLKVIAFNGKKAAQLFGKHIGSIQGIKLTVLPSTSPANAGVPLETKKEEWNKLKKFLE